MNACFRTKDLASAFAAQDVDAFLDAIRELRTSGVWIAPEAEFTHAPDRERDSIKIAGDKLYISWLSRWGHRASGDADGIRDGETCWRSKTAGGLKYSLKDLIE